VKRIAILGCGGSGKSTLATRLGAVLNVPVTHLDQLFWRAGWVERSREEFAAAQRLVCTQPAWIMDGNYIATIDIRLATADTIVFLDRATLACLWGAVWRFLRYCGRTRPDMTAGCPEQLSWEYVRWILSYRRKIRPQILARLAARPATQCVIILRSSTAVRRWLCDPAICPQRPA